MEGGTLPNLSWRFSKSVGWIAKSNGGDLFACQVEGGTLPNLSWRFSKSVGWIAKSNGGDLFACQVEGGTLPNLSWRFSKSVGWIAKSNGGGPLCLQSGRGDPSTLFFCLSLIFLSKKTQNSSTFNRIADNFHQITANSCRAVA